MGIVGAENRDDDDWRRLLRERGKERQELLRVRRRVIDEQLFELVDDE